MLCGANRTITKFYRRLSTAGVTMNKIDNIEISSLENPRFCLPREIKFDQDGKKRRWEMVDFPDAVFGKGL